MEDRWIDSDDVYRQRRGWQPPERVIVSGRLAGTRGGERYVHVGDFITATHIYNDRGLPPMTGSDHNDRQWLGGEGVGSLCRVHGWTMTSVVLARMSGQLGGPDGSREYDSTAGYTVRSIPRQFVRLGTHWPMAAACPVESMLEAHAAPCGSWRLWATALRVRVGRKQELPRLSFVLEPEHELHRWKETLRVPGLRHRSIRSGRDMIGSDARVAFVLVESDRISCSVTQRELDHPAVVAVQRRGCFIVPLLGPEQLREQLRKEGL